MIGMEVTLGWKKAADRNVSKYWLWEDYVFSLHREASTNNMQSVFPSGRSPLYHKWVKILLQLKAQTSSPFN